MDFRMPKFFLLAAIAGFCLDATSAAADFANAKLHVQVDFENIDEKSLPLYLADAKAAGADSFQIAVIDFFGKGERRRKDLERLKWALAEARKAGFATAVWTSSLGYGNTASQDTFDRFADSTRLTAIDGKAHRKAAF